MLDRKCPGQDMKFWKPEDIYEVPCPICDHPVEFFKDDPSRTCPNCGYRFQNPKIDLSCAEWCPYAERCFAAMGKTLPEEVLQRRKDRGFGTGGGQGDDRAGEKPAEND